MKADLILRNCSELVTLAGPCPRKGNQMDNLAIVKNGSFAIKDGLFVAVGIESEIVSNYESETIIDASGCCVLPGFVDSHTHIIFAGDRSAEFEMRLQGATYEEIMAKGGGILNTVSITRLASYEELYAQSAKRLKTMIKTGTTAFEMKSGYGLEANVEMKMLMVAKKLIHDFGVEAKTTFMGAHAIPKDIDRNDFISLVKGEMLYVCKPYSDFIDVFCDKGAFTNEETEEIVKDSGLPVRLHVDELADTGGASLAAKLGAVSADHLIGASNKGFEDMARSGTVATFLPGTSFFLGKPFARAKKAIESGCVVAIASDRNPGSCTIQSMPFVVGLACLRLGMTPAQAISAATINAAYSIRSHDRIGSIEKGKRADFVIYGVESYRMIPYELGVNHAKMTFIKGKEASWPD